MPDHPGHVFHRDSRSLPVEAIADMAAWGADDEETYEAASDGLFEITMGRYEDVPAPAERQRRFEFGLGVILGCALASVFWIVLLVVAVAT